MDEGHLAAVLGMAAIIGGCIIGGCMDSTATNFQPLASAPLVPCEFAPEPSCFGDADGDGLVGLSDLLTFLSAMGQTCN